MVDEEIIHISIICLAHFVTIYIRSTSSWGRYSVSGYRSVTIKLCTNPDFVPKENMVQQWFQKFPVTWIFALLMVCDEKKAASGRAILVEWIGLG